jgi:F-type H+-transporting ATPase subunit a
MKRKMRSRISSFYLSLAVILGLAFSLNTSSLQAQGHEDHAHGDTVHAGHDAHATTGHDAHATTGHDAHGGMEAAGGHGGQELEDDIADVIIHHVMDTHDWHLADVGETPIALHLPWILYNSKTGLEFFTSTHSMVENANYVESHDKVYYVSSKTPVREFHISIPKDAKLAAAAQGQIAAEKKELADFEKENAGKYAFVHHKGISRNAAGEKEALVEHVAVYPLVEGATLIDLSLTKTGLQILIVAIVMFLIFTSVARAYKKRDGLAPKGLQGFMEVVILFVRDDVTKPYLHGKHERFLPYFLTLFFFIWFSNMFGLTPLSSNIAGNTTITIMLAMLTLILIVLNSTKDFWMHILWFPGVPIWMKPLMLVVELMGFFTKPAALAIRLFANISAGHFMVLALICLIFILGDNGHSTAGAITIMPLSVAFSLFIFAVELLVAAVQAFVFSLLTAVFIGQAMETHGHDEHHDEHAEVAAHH